MSQLCPPCLSWYLKSSEKKDDMASIPSSDPQPDQIQNEKDLFLASELAHVGISPMEFSVLEALRYSSSDAPYLLRDVVSACEHRSDKECGSAIESCVEKGLIQTVDDVVLLNLFNIVRARSSIGPISGFPRCGTLDYTPRGATVYQNLWRGLYDIELKYLPHLRDTQCYSCITRETETHYFGSSKGALAFASGLDLVGETISSVRIEESVPWRRHWWELIPEGYKVTVEMCQPTNRIFRFWRASESAIALERPEAREKQLDEEQSRRYVQRQSAALEVCGVSWAEWCILRHLGAEGFASHQSIAQHASSESADLGLKQLSPDECVEALRSCIERGWVWTVNESVIRRISEYLSISGGGELLKPISDISPDSATLSLIGAQLFRQVFGLAFGNACSFDFWRYKSEPGAAGVHGEHAERETTTEIYTLTKERAIRELELPYTQRRIHRVEGPLSIGSWCVYWWKTFPAGWKNDDRVDDKIVKGDTAGTQLFLSSLARV
jgi:hypothetical protein